VVLSGIGGWNESGPIHQMLEGEEGEEGEGVEGEVQRGEAQKQVPKKLQAGMSRFLVNWRRIEAAKNKLV
jgi:hypothetical protein